MTSRPQRGRMMGSVLKVHSTEHFNVNYCTTVRWTTVGNKITLGLTSFKNLIIIHVLLWPEYYVREKYLSTVGGSNGEGTSGILCCPDAVSKGFTAIVGLIINTSRHWRSSKKNQIGMLTNNSTFWEPFEFFLNTMNTLCIFPTLGKTSYTKLSVTQKSLPGKTQNTVLYLRALEICCRVHSL